jgi:RND family efflux transporter MFP subunit
MKTAIRVIGILLVAVLIVGAGALLLRQQTGLSLPGSPAAAETPQPVATATRGNIQETVSATGNVTADLQTTLTFASSGTIAEVLVEKGQAVEAGDVLATLNTSSLEWQIARSQASLETAQARLEQAQQPASAEDLASAQAALDNAVANYENVKDGASTEDLASAQAALDSANASYRKLMDGPTREDLASVQAALDSARSAVQQAQAAYDRVKQAPDIAARQESLNLENATTELERAQANYDSVAKGATASDLAAAEAQVAQAEAQLAQLLERPKASELAAAEAQVAQAEAQLAQLQELPRAEDVAVAEAQVEEATVALSQAESQLDDALITAPFDGAVLAVEIREGEWGTPGAPAIVLAATEPLVLEANIDEVDVAQVSEGQMALLSFDALKDIQADSISGEVTYIAPASTNVGGAVAYAVEVSFSPGDLPVRLGMTADLDIVAESANDALLVPNQAVESDRAAGRYYVTILLPDRTTERVEVIIGLRDENQTQIIEGLEEGAVVVLPQVPEQVITEQQFGPPGGGGGGRFGGD